MAFFAKNACHAWANLSGDSNPPTLRNSYNVSSVQDNGTGDYTFSFTTNFGNGSFSITTLACQSSSVDDAGFSGLRAQSVSGARCFARTSRTSGMTDFPLFCFSAHGTQP